MSKHQIGRIAMFVTGESVSIDDVNNVLTAGHDYLNRSVPGYIHPVFWLVSDPPHDAPKYTTDGTKAPIDHLPKFIGKDPGYLARHLREDLSSAFLKQDVFVVLDDRAARDGSVMVCHIDTKDDDNDKYSTEEPKVEAIRETPRAAALDLYGRASWVELRENWKGAKNGGSDVLDIINEAGVKKSSARKIPT